MHFLVTEWRRLLVALGFLTRLPLGGTVYDEADFRGSVLWFPVVGLIVGALQGVTAWGAVQVFPVPVASALALAVAIILSGGLHLDGLMDTADGLASGKPPDEALVIMRDSRVGAHGVTAAVVVLLLQFTAILALASGGHFQLIAALAAVAMLSRTAMVLAIVLYPYRRAQGLGTCFQMAGRRELFWALGWAAGLAWVLLSWQGLVLLALAAGFSLAYGRWLVRFLGGLTGDTYGALAELETTLLLLATLLILG